MSIGGSPDRRVPGAGRSVTGALEVAKTALRTAATCFRTPRGQRRYKVGLPTAGLVSSTMINARSKYFGTCGR